MNKRYIDFVPKKSASDARVVLPGQGDAKVVLPEKKTVVTMPAGAGRRGDNQSGGHGGASASRDVVKRGGGARRGGIDMMRRVVPKSKKVASGDVKVKTEPKAVDEKATMDEVVLDEIFEVREKTAPARKPREMEPEEIFEEALMQAKDAEVKKAKIPKSPFLSGAKINKRPLSKNVYPKKPVVEPKEESHGPVTIIERPEKDSRARLVVTIIITIILGAAAGTVAFLLLPK